MNVVLIELDRWPDSSLLVAATNHPQLLDSAVGRRFDRQVEFELPGVEERRRILGHLASMSGLADDTVLDMAVDLLDGASGSDLTRLWLRIQRRSLLDSRSPSDVLLAELASTALESGPQRDRLWLAMPEHLGLSNRQIAARAGVSHPTVASALERARSHR